MEGGKQEGSRRAGEAGENLEEGEGRRDGWRAGKQEGGKRGRENLDAGEDRREEEAKRKRQKGGGADH
jgi:hypothetical protein